MSFRRPSHQIQYVDPTKKRPPPIPRGSSGGAVPANIQRAREQIARERNLQRAREITEKARSPFGRSAGLSKAQLQDVEQVFQAGVIRDDIEAQRKRDAERQAIHNFQNRSGRINSRELARRRKQIEDARNHGQQLTQELLITALAKRRFGAGLPIDQGEEEIRKFLGDKFGGDKNAQAQAELFGRLLGELPKPKKAPLSAVIGTQSKPKSKPPPIPKKQPEPEPEPEPIPEPQPEPQVQFKTGGNFPDAGKFDIPPDITKDEFAKRFGVGVSP